MNKTRIEDAINDYLKPLEIGFEKLGDAYTSNEIKKAINEITLAIQED